MKEEQETAAKYQTEWKEWKAKHLARHSVQNKNKEAQKKLKSYAEKSGILQKQYEMVGNLSRTANGNLFQTDYRSGKQKACKNDFQ